MFDADTAPKALVCPVCDATSRLWVRLLNAVLYRCADCSHCFTDTNSVKVAESYGSDYYLATHKNWFENPNMPLFALLRSELLHRDAKSVLDVGCGNGAFLKFIASVDADRDLHGIDLSGRAASQSIAFHRGDFLTFDFGRKFDAVVSLAVIEHLDDVRAFVYRIHQLLNEGGTAYLMTLNEDSILYRLANVLRVAGMRAPFVRLYDAHHVNHFNRASLLRLVTQRGLFKVERVINHNAPLPSVDVPGGNALIRALLKLAVWGTFWAGKLTGRTYLQTIIVTKVP